MFASPPPPLQSIYHVDSTPKSINHATTAVCSHAQTVKDGNYVTCQDCGERIKQHMEINKEWRYYPNNNDGHRNSSNPSRCHYRTEPQISSILDDLRDFRFDDGSIIPEDIANKADRLYKLVTGGQTRRKGIRHGLIHVALIKAYGPRGNIKKFQQIQKYFKLSKKKISQAHNEFGKCRIPENFACVTPIEMIPEILKTLNIDQDIQINHIMVIYNQVKNRSDTLFRAKPQSIAGGLIYYFCALSQHKTMTVEDIAEAVNLSPVTIKKVAEEIDGILKTGIISKRRVIRR
jgi:transcription initiation factor TFIIIB Brf1 subunit/transcription initiation factor TFIIB